MHVIKISLFSLAALLLISGCASQGMKRFGYDILSNYECSTTNRCSNFTNAHTYQTMYKTQCLGGNALPGCEQAPPLNYDDYIGERQEALEGIKVNR